MKVEKDISFLRSGRTEKMDIYIPEGGAVPRPGVIVIHGGGWYSGKKDSPREVNICSKLADQGFLCAGIDYLLAEDSRPESAPHVWPENLMDCKQAVYFLRENAARYGIDPYRIAALGSSAGGHLAALLGCTRAEHGLDPGIPSRRLPGYDSKAYPFAVSCVVSMYGVADPAKWIVEACKATKGMQILKQIMGGTPEEVPEGYKTFSPLHYADRRTCPFLLIHGTDDSIVPVSHSEYFNRELTERGVECKLIVVPGAAHSFHLEPEGMDLVSPVADFIRRPYEAGGPFHLFRDI
jgi:acetyl esterase/lipase